MSKNILVATVILFVLIGVGFYFIKSPTDNSVIMDKVDNSPSMDKESEPLIKEESSMMKKDEVMMKVGSYETYSPEKLALAETGDVVLFFRASWCPTCRTLDGDIKANANTIPTGVTILDVNYDTSTALKQKYGVTYQHTLVQVDSSGNQIAKWMGSPNLASLITNIK